MTRHLVVVPRLPCLHVWGQGSKSASRGRKTLIKNPSRASPLVLVASRPRGKKNPKIKPAENNSVNKLQTWWNDNDERKDVTAPGASEPQGPAWGESGPGSLLVVITRRAVRGVPRWHPGGMCYSGWLWPFHGVEQPHGYFADHYGPFGGSGISS